ncbi:MAG: nucleotidyltransferase family protein [Rhodanobacteraceae bacterium]|nr:nucleotidyltransferase family protein [Rhodanobacteraceae bacterium]
MIARHGVIVLAAGASRRLGQPKQLLQIEGETLLHRTVRLAMATQPLDLVAVLGHAATGSVSAIADLATRCVEAPATGGGMGASLACGLKALSASCEGVLVLVCDQPALDATHLRAMLTRWQKQPGSAVASGYADTWGVPALLPRPWLSTLTLDGDHGARDLLRRRKSEVQIVVNEALAQDVDHPSDLVLHLKERPH